MSFKIIRKFSCINSLVFLLLLTSCADEEEVNSSPKEEIQPKIMVKKPQPQIKLHELEIEFSKNLTAKEHIFSMINQVENKEFINSKELIKATLEQHITNFSRDFNLDENSYKRPLVDYFRPLIAGISNEDHYNQHELKVAYEEGLLALHNNLMVNSGNLLSLDDNLIKYNKEHSNIFSPLHLNKIQSYSGTLLFDLLLRDYKKEDYHNLNQVFIYEEGHILPGYMKQIDGEWHLFGVETTLMGPAKKIYGATKNLSDVKVVYAQLALGIDILKDAIQNKQDVTKAALEKTASLYNIPLENIEERLLNSEMSENLTSEDPKVTNSSLFSFGESKSIPEGDIVRPNVIEFSAESIIDSKELLIQPVYFKSNDNYM